MSEQTKSKSFAVTLRPKEGITDADVSAIVKLVKRLSSYYAIVTEKTDEERHVHAACFLKKPMLKSNFVQAFTRLLKESWEERGSIWKHACKVCYIYNDDWVNNYLAKNDDTVVIEKNMPEHTMEAYFGKAIEKSTSVKVANPYLEKLERMYLEEHTVAGHVCTRRTVEVFLERHMYAKRDLRVEMDPRKAKRLIWALNHFINRRGKEKTESSMPWYDGVQVEEPAMVC